MGSSTVFYAIGDLFQWIFQLFQYIGDIANYSFIILGFIGLFYWLNLQKKFNAAAAKDPNKLP